MCRRRLGDPDGQFGDGHAMRIERRLHELAKAIVVFEIGERWHFPQLVKGFEIELVDFDHAWMGRDGIGERLDVP